ncbi:AI-2E family transporter [Marinobacter salicampi]|uniref:AI-2E family transporter n=1 Tax=Marinobacter salicampi TaxID=435907 RepID=UPI00140E5506|nr:AI-2E family transporter [Marinobacter salicampi]
MEDQSSHSRLEQTHNNNGSTRASPAERLFQGDLATPLQGLFMLGILYTLYAAHSIILPIVLAIMTSLLLSPLVYRGYRMGIPRVASALVLMLLLIAGLAGVGWAVGQPALDWAEEAPDSLSEILVGDSVLKTQIDKLNRSAEQMEESVEGLSDNGAEPQPVILATESWRSQVLSKLRNGLAGLALALALTYFLLVGGDRLIQNFVRQLPRRRRRKALQIVRGSQEEIARYLAVIGISNTVVGVVTGLMAWAVGLPTPAVWGVVAGLARFIPYLGVIMTIAILAVVSAASLDELWMIAILPVGYLVLTALVGFFIEPWIHGFRMAINPVVIFISIFFWGWLWGPVGVLLAVPLMTVIQVVLKQIPKLRPIYRVIAR